MTGLTTSPYGLLQDLHWLKGLDSKNRDRRTEPVLLHKVASPNSRDGHSQTHLIRSI